mmetsp:Transcript_63826/g.152223  ORF Transcript_63826/g.152223 Transcript_63826/m.152223 type:complete len:259 (+) Transcript_63826:235-1011(+)
MNPSAHGFRGFCPASPSRGVHAHRRVRAPSTSYPATCVTFPLSNVCFTTWAPILAWRTSPYVTSRHPRLYEGREGDSRSTATSNCWGDIMWNVSGVSQRAVGRLPAMSEFWNIPGTVSTEIPASARTNARRASPIGHPMYLLTFICSADASIASLFRMIPAPVSAIRTWRPRSHPCAQNSTAFPMYLGPDFLCGRASIAAKGSRKTCVLSSTSTNHLACANCSRMRTKADTVNSGRHPSCMSSESGNIFSFFSCRNFS